MRFNLSQIFFFTLKTQDLKICQKSRLWQRLLRQQDQNKLRLKFYAAKLGHLGRKA